MSATYRYTVEDSDLACTEASAEEAEAMRADDWVTTDDFPGIEHARGIDAAGKRVRLYRVPATAARHTPDPDSSPN